MVKRSEKRKKFIKTVKLNKKFLIPAFIFIIIFLGIVYYGNIKIGEISTSIKTIDNAINNIDAIKVGDIIKYEVNGQEDWKVIYIDKDSGTVDVVSDSNTTEIEITPENYQEAENKFNTEAAKFKDDKYIIASRTVSKSDLDYFAFDQKFWLSNINENTISYNIGYWKNKYDSPGKLYYFPWISIIKTGENNYNQGDDYNISINGIDNWYVYEDYGSELYLIPKVPLEIIIEPDFSISDYLEQVRNDFIQGGAQDAGNALRRYSAQDVFEYIKGNFQDIQKEVYFYYDDGTNQQSKAEYDLFELYCAAKYNKKENRFDWCYNYQYKTAKSLKIGYRPVLTLKLTDTKNAKEKQLTTDLQVGDYVKYSANGYSSWRILSIDKSNSTAEIISTGVVKNLELKGKDSYDNLETILQGEVDLYKSGDNAISARSVEYIDQANLDKLKDTVLPRYWLNNKREKNETTNQYNTSSPYQLLTKYDIAVMRYQETDRTQYMEEKKGPTREWITVYYGQNGDEYVYTPFEYEGYGYRAYTAGIRPVITVKLDTIEKMDKDEQTKAEAEANQINKKLLTQQKAANTEYNEKNKVSKETVEERSKTGEDNSEYNNYYYTNDNSDKLYKYLLIIVILLFTLNIFVVLSYFIIPKLINKDLSE